MLDNSSIKLKYFSRDEFRGWYDEINPELLKTLERFRYYWGDVVLISPADGAIGRRLGPNGNSQHNIDKWGFVNAVDVMPRGMDSRYGRKEAYLCAIDAGAKGIGIYPDWKPYPGVHIDMREHSSHAKWSALKINGKQQYFAIEEVF